METGTKIGRLTKSSFFENLADEDRSLKNNLVTLTWSSLLLLVTNRMIFSLLLRSEIFLTRGKKKKFHFVAPKNVAPVAPSVRLELRRARARPMKLGFGVSGVRRKIR